MSKACDQVYALLSVRCFQAFVRTAICNELVEVKHGAAPNRERLSTFQLSIVSFTPSRPAHLLIDMMMHRNALIKVGHSVWAGNRANSPLSRFRLSAREELLRRDEVGPRRIGVARKREELFVIVLG